MGQSSRCGGAWFLATSPPSAVPDLWPQQYAATHRRWKRKNGHNNVYIVQPLQIKQLLQPLFKLAQASILTKSLPFSILLDLVYNMNSIIKVTKNAFTLRVIWCTYLNILFFLLTFFSCFIMLNKENLYFLFLDIRMF